MAPPLALTEVRRIVEEEQDALRRLSEEEALLGNRIRQAGPTRRAEQAHSFIPAVRTAPPDGASAVERASLLAASQLRAAATLRALDQRLDALEARADALLGLGPAPPTRGSRGLREFRGLEVERTRPEHVGMSR